MRKLKISRILILFVVLILVVTASIYCIRTFFRQDEIIEEKSYYDLDLFSMENGCKDEYLSDFFGYFFIRKCMWSTPDTVKSTMASLKKFYRFMYESNRLSKEDYEEFMDTIRIDKEYWIDCCSKYNDGISEW